MPTEAQAVESLTELGLTEYEARCFIALTRLSEGTANEISQVADIPQSRVYDVAESLYQRGLVDIQESDPRKYYAVPVPMAIKQLEQEYTQSLERAREHLTSLESRQTETNGVWEIASQHDLVNRVIMHADDAEDEIYLHIADEDLLEPEVLDVLSNAYDRGVRILVEVPSESARERVYDTIPEARVAISDLSFDPLPEGEHRPGRLLMIDRETILMSALDEGLVPGETNETGLWGAEVGRGLVIWLRELLESRMDHLDFQTADD